LVLRGTVFAHNIFLDGNTFRDSHSVAKEPLVGLVIAGLHYEQKTWAIRLGAMVSSDNMDTDRVTAAEDRELLGTIDIEWRF